MRKKLVRTIRLDPKTIELVDELVQRGLYGKNDSEVIRRLVDKGLQDIFEIPRIPLTEQGNGTS